MSARLEATRVIANTSARTDHDIKSPVRAYQIVESLKTLWNSKSSQLKFWTRQLAELIENKAWLLIPEEKPYGSLEAMMQAEVGCSVDEFFAFMKLIGIEGDLLITLAKQNPLGYRSAGPGRGNKKDDNAPPIKKGNSREYLARRLARDNPDLLDEIGEGKQFKSVRQAAIYAGIVKPKTILRFDPDESGPQIAEKLRMKLTDDQLKELRESL